MKTVQDYISIIEEQGIGVDPYEENGILCGYELNTYTNAGVNEIIFLDFRNEGESAENPDDFIKEFERYMSDYTLDDRIESNRQNAEYRRDFTLKQSLEDFEAWGEMITGIIEKLKE